MSDESDGCTYLVRCARASERVTPEGFLEFDLLGSQIARPTPDRKVGGSHCN